MISIGLDVGREHDPAALCVLRSGTPPHGGHRPAWHVLDIGNIPRGTDYTDLAAQAAGLTLEFADAGYDAVLTIDATGIGAAVVELARKQAPEQRIYAVTIGAGRSLTSSGGGDFTVGKHRLTEVLQVAMERSRLTIDEQASPDGVGEFQRQLGRFVRKPGKRGYQKHEAAKGHDDLVLAVELAMWTGDAMADDAAGVST